MRIDRVITNLSQSLGKVIDALSNNLTPQDNWQAKIIGPIITPGVADTEFTVSHKLGIVPVHYLWNVDKGAVVYDSRRDQWTDAQLFLKCSLPTVTAYLIVF